jgi:hypothetical protein
MLFRNVAPYRMGQRYKCFGGILNLHLYDKRVRLVVLSLTIPETFMKIYHITSLYVFIDTAVRYSNLERQD